MLHKQKQETSKTKVSGAYPNRKQYNVLKSMVAVVDSMVKKSRQILVLKSVVAVVDRAPKANTRLDPYLDLC
ncbi:hypothetical protein FRX31_030294 [Thalictrum thalictroides]|uniref:Uncharacterized protein n=1 Tax=Thalictrum thalictroides TaxID=46969 RepID=A0A7J6V5Z5_THATH|nr:hypothetical protein FRX31_030294 [Thalictrum thalictroides]